MSESVMVASCFDEAVRLVITGEAEVAVYGYIDSATNAFYASIVCADEEVAKAISELYLRESRFFRPPGSSGVCADRLPLFLIQGWPVVGRRADRITEEVRGDIEGQLSINSRG